MGVQGVVRKGGGTKEPFCEYGFIHSPLDLNRHDAREGFLSKKIFIMSNTFKISAVVSQPRS